MNSGASLATGAAMVRVSVAELAPILIDEKTGEVFYPVILNPNAKNNFDQDLYQPIGGAVEFTDEGRAYFVENFGVNPDSFYKRDARFHIEESRLEEAMSIFENFRKYPGLIIIDLSRELREELSTPEIKGIPAIMTPKDTDQIWVELVRVSRQLVSKTGDTSPLANKEAPSRRLFYIYAMKAPREIIEKMRQSPAIKFLTPEEIATTKGGTCKGTTLDGKAIADNVYHTYP